MSAASSGGVCMIVESRLLSGARASAVPGSARIAVSRSARARRNCRAHGESVCGNIQVFVPQKVECNAS
jgi:hypothetical protein